MEQGQKPTSHSLDNKLKPVIMALRETLMIYYKGDCVARVKNEWRTSIKVINLSYETGEGGNLRNYQRNQLERENESLLVVKTLPVATLRLYPNRLTFHKSIIYRSSQLEMLHKAILEVLKTYLPHVQKDYTDAKLPVMLSRSII